MDELQRYDGGRNAPNGVAGFLQRVDLAPRWAEQSLEDVAIARCRMAATTEVAMHAMDELGSLMRHHKAQALCTFLAMDQAMREAEEGGADLGAVRDGIQEESCRYRRTLEVLYEGAAQRIIERTERHDLRTDGC